MAFKRESFHDNPEFIRRVREQRGTADADAAAYEEGKSVLILDPTTGEVYYQPLVRRWTP
jgi:hypothetical protein